MDSEIQDAIDGFKRGEDIEIISDLVRQNNNPKNFALKLMWIANGMKYNPKTYDNTDEVKRLYRSYHNYMTSLIFILKRQDKIISESKGLRGEFIYSKVIYQTVEKIIHYFGYIPLKDVNI